MNTKTYPVAQLTANLSEKLSWVVERVCVLLMILLILDVWLGVVARYLIPMPITFTEELARYLMIWMALLAVSVGISKRQHIGVEFIFNMFSKKMRRLVLLVLDVLAFCLFATLFIYGIDMVIRGGKSYTMIFGITKSLPFAAVPIAAFICCVQLVLVAIRDQLFFDMNYASEQEA